MICPLMSCRDDMINEECRKERCAWWVENKNQTVVTDFGTPEAKINDNVDLSCCAIKLISERIS